MCEGLENLGFVQSKIDECVWYKGTTIFMYFVDDGILAGPNKNKIDEIIKVSKNLLKQETILILKIVATSPIT